MHNDGAAGPNHFGGRLAVGTTKQAGTKMFYSPSNNNVGEAKVSQLEEMRRQYSSN